MTDPSVELKEPSYWEGRLSNLYSMNKPKIDREKLLSKSAFCEKCAYPDEKIGYLAKLFSAPLATRRIRPPAPPADDTPESAKAYMDGYLAAVLHEVEQVTSDEAFKIGQSAVEKFAVDFSGKIIHSGMEGAFGFAMSAQTNGLPYLSSRQLLSHGTKFLRDYSKNDSTGAYQRIKGILENDGEAQKYGVPEKLIQAIREGGESGLLLAQKTKVDFVDSRARQILLPAGDGYISLSPLVSGWMCQLMDDAVGVIEKTAHEAELAATATEEPEGAKKSKKTKKISESRAPKAVSRLYTRIGLGGANKQNITYFGNAVKNTYLFSAPQPGVLAKNAYRFLFRPWVPFIHNNDLSHAEKGLVASVFGGMEDTISGISIESKKLALIALVRKCHWQAVDMSAALMDATVKFGADGKIVKKVANPDKDGSEENITEPEARPIDENIVKANRHDGLMTALDMAVVNRVFNQDYREAMAQEITKKIERHINRDPKNQIIRSAVDARRITAAIVKILEGITK